MGDITSGIVRLIAIFSMVVGTAAFFVGRWAAAPSKPQRVEQSGGYDDLLVHPETTPEVKWVKMTKPTRDALLEIYALNMSECSRYMDEENGVTIGESAIMWLIDTAKAE